MVPALIHSGPSLERGMGDGAGKEKKLPPSDLGGSGGGCGSDCCGLRVGGSVEYDDVDVSRVEHDSCGSEHEFVHGGSRVDDVAVQAADGVRDEGGRLSS